MKKETGENRYHGNRTGILYAASSFPIIIPTFQKQKTLRKTSIALTKKGSVYLFLQLTPFISSLLTNFSQLLGGKKDEGPDPEIVWRLVGAMISLCISFGSLQILISYTYIKKRTSHVSNLGPTWRMVSLNEFRLIGTC